MPEPFILSVNPRTHPLPVPGLLSNGWPPLVLSANSKAVIPGVSTNAVGKNYRVLHKIGMGSFGEIYLGVDIRTNERIAIKVENRTTKYPQLMEEYQVYRAVAKGIGVPAAIWWSVRACSRVPHVACDAYPACAHARAPSLLAAARVCVFLFFVVSPVVLIRMCISW